MKCPKCGSENVNVQVVNEIQLKNQHHSIIWWLFIGCWWVPIKWIFLTLPAFIVKLFGHKKKKIKNITHSKAVCQSCGYTWNV